jgi:hypothetical protein
MTVHCTVYCTVSVYVFFDVEMWQDGAKFGKWIDTIIDKYLQIGEETNAWNVSTVFGISSVQKFRHVLYCVIRIYSTFAFTYCWEF